MSVTIEHTKVPELHERMQGVLAAIGMEYEELADLASRHVLTPEELAAWDEVRSIRYLLGE
ncbi:hypothetical protein [Tsukamurella hominis]|uniref:hypothetical protein n=1 Tax=Tsukamurella hominis TaxID=1970232 RepID=UPI0039E80778